MKQAVAVMRYETASLALSHRWVAPWLLYVAVLAIVYAHPPGPAVPTFGVTGFALLPVAAFLTRAQLHAEDGVSRQVTVATAGGPGRIQGALLAAAALGVLALGTLAVAWGTLATWPHPHGALAWPSGSAIIGGLAIHLVFGLVGAAIGALFSRPVSSGLGPAVLGIVLVSMVALVVRVTPTATFLRALIHDPRHGFAGAAVPPALVTLAVAGAGLGYSLLRAARS